MSDNKRINKYTDKNRTDGICVMIQQLDPLHATMTGVSSRKQRFNWVVTKEDVLMKAL